MRKIIWSPGAVRDYTSIIDYLNTTWTTKEVQRLIDKVISALSVLEKGSFDFKKVGI
jgi:plasmid stabilization system protein ParE